jgi:flagellar hook protein FlgE
MVEPSATTEAGATFSKAFEVYDSLGASHVVTVTFEKSTTANEWEYSISVPDDDVETPITPVAGTLTFNSEGRLESPSDTDDPPEIVPWFR